MDPVVLVIVAAMALVAVGFVAWQAALGAGVVAAYRDRAADTRPSLAVFVEGGAARPRLLVRNRGEIAVVRVVALERLGLAPDPSPLAALERIEPGAAASVEVSGMPTAPSCHLEWTPDRPGATRRQADVPFLVLGGGDA